MREPRSPHRLWAVCAVSALVAIAVSLFFGPTGLDGTPVEAISAWWSAPNPASMASALFTLRLSRVLLAAVVGVALGVAGTTLQALLRNPLADPFIIGVSGAAALGGALAVAITGATSGPVLVSASVGGAFLATLGLAWVMARRDVVDGATTALLVGVVVNGFASALITLIKTLVSAAKAQSLLFWLVGTVGYPSFEALAITAALVLAATVVLAAVAGDLELMRAGDLEAERLGVHVVRTRVIAYIAASTLVGAIVPLTGLIGFIGLVLPHALRLVFGADLRVLLVASALVGAAVLPLFDAAARSSFALVDTEVPVGALTALVGAPVFIAMLLRRGGPR